MATDATRVTTHPDTLVPPNDLEAEKAVLGALLLHGDRIDDVIGTLTPERFYRSAHRQIYAAMCELAKAGKPIEFFTVRDQLARAKARGGDTTLLDDIGGPGYLTSLTDGLPRIASVETYAERVVETARLRHVIAVCTQTLKEAYAAEDDARQIVDRAEMRLLQLAESRTSEFVSAQDLVAQCWPAVAKLLETKAGITGIPSGFADLDEMTGGWQRGDLILIGARSSMGKTSLALDIARHAATHGHRAGIFSLEMSRQELFIRMLTAEARVDSHRLKRGYVAQTEYGRLGDAMARIDQSLLAVNDAPTMGVLEMRAQARRLKAKHGLDMLLVDYLQITAGDRRYDNRVAELGVISRSLKALARELNIPVIALSQLSRAPEQRAGDKRPQLSDLRESGALEQDADVVLLIYRAEQYKPTDENAGIAEIIISKQRNGPTGTVKLGWVKEHTRFTNLSERDEQRGGALPYEDR